MAISCSSANVTGSLLPGSRCCGRLWKIGCPSGDCTLSSGWKIHAMSRSFFGSCLAVDEEQRDAPEWSRLRTSPCTCTSGNSGRGSSSACRPSSGIGSETPPRWLGFQTNFFFATGVVEGRARGPGGSGPSGRSSSASLRCPASTEKVIPKLCRGPGAGTPGTSSSSRRARVREPWPPPAAAGRRVMGHLDDLPDVLRVEPPIPTSVSWSLSVSPLICLARSRSRNRTFPAPARPRPASYRAGEPHAEHGVLDLLGDHRADLAEVLADRLHLVHRPIEELEVAVEVARAPA